MLSYLCDISGVSRSGYYNYFLSKSKEMREKREKQDEEARDLILKAYNYKGRKKGARQIKMTLERKFNVVFNLKCIRRIMKKYEIICPIRKPKPYKKMIKATKEHTTKKNDLNREFKQGVPGKVLLTDITYLLYGRGKRAYLSTIKDGSTNEILAYNLSENLTLDIALDTIHILMKKHKNLITQESFIHSDQGSHYTSPVFQKLLKKYKLGQSMSRRGNCWDNAPQESFYGHFKDEAFISDCENFNELKKEIDDYMNYYNNDRYQWDLKKMTPVEYRNHLIQLN